MVLTCCRLNSSCTNIRRNLKINMNRRSDEGRTKREWKERQPEIPTTASNTHTVTSTSGPFRFYMQQFWWCHHFFSSQCPSSSPLANPECDSHLTATPLSSESISGYLLVRWAGSSAFYPRTPPGDCILWRWECTWTLLGLIALNY